uniref:PX domain-containing protein n=1 Tax=Felis catus TaxID=9685 RepID=A0ABI7XRF0_FELCA
MASAVFEGTSLVNMFVRGCWVNGIRRLIVSRRGDEEEFFEIRTEWSDRSVLYLHRSFADLGRLWQRLRDAFPEDRPELARAPLRQGLVAIKDAHDIETRLNEVEKLLKTIISMPCKYSRSEVVLTFFERSPLDQVLKNDNVHKIQPSFQSPVKISEIMRSNGFCLANTETIVIDHSIPNGKDQHLGVDPTEHLRSFWRERVLVEEKQVETLPHHPAGPWLWPHSIPRGDHFHLQEASGCHLCTWPDLTSKLNLWIVLPRRGTQRESKGRRHVTPPPHRGFAWTSMTHPQFENGSEFTSELEDGDDPAAYVTNLSYYHLVPFETDILD